MRVDAADILEDRARVLVLALHAHHPDTGDHSRRVGQMALALGEELGLTGRSLNTLYLGCLLHDLGKVGVCQTVLNAPRRLTENEKLQLYAHPTVGAEMLRGLFPEEVVRVAAEHHEWYDGTGYPEGLYQDAISQEARVCAVVDAYDAMVSDRAYRRALPHEAAVRELWEYAGTQFDPGVVSAFGRAWRHSRFDH